jgi:acyl transferase domain-containing protein
MLTALIFPGQGSQDPAMEAAVRRWAPDLLARLEELVGAKPFARLDEGTLVVQPAMFCADVAAWRALAADGVKADAFAGHSVGDFAALVAAGALDVSDGLRLVAARGEIFAAVSGSDGGGMLALLGATHELAAKLAASWGLDLANHNSPSQFVLAGNRETFAKARADSRRLGLRAVELAVKGAFHSPAMSAAVTPFLEVLDTVRFRAPVTPVYSSATGKPFDDIGRRLAEGITAPVRWHEVMGALHTLGVRRFIEAGPGEVLTQLVRRTLPDDVLALSFAKALSGVRSARATPELPGSASVPHSEQTSATAP